MGSLYQPEHYDQQLQHLLPVGAAWPRPINSNLASLLAIFAPELARVDARACDLLNEADPRTTYELLAEWEEALGLPEPCFHPEEQTVEERRQAVIAKLRRLGGASRQYFIDLAATIGYNIEITEYRARRHNQRHGEVYIGSNWVHYWKVHVIPQADGEPRVTSARRHNRQPHGERYVHRPAVAFNAAGYRRHGSLHHNPYRSWGEELLECVFNRLKPAHTQIIYSYGV